MYKGSKHSGNVVISNHETNNMSRDTQLSFIVKLGAPTKITRLWHTLQHQLLFFQTVYREFCKQQLPPILNPKIKRKHGRFIS